MRQMYCEYIGQNFKPIPEKKVFCWTKVCPVSGVKFWSAPSVLKPPIRSENVTPVLVMKSEKYVALDDHSISPVLEYTLPF